MSMTQRRLQIQHLHKDGVDIVKIPVKTNRNRPEDTYCTMFTSDFNRLLDMNIIPVFYYYSVDESRPEDRYVKVRCDRSGAYRQVSRLLLRAKVNQRVSYLNNDRLDLRRSNLVLSQTNGSTIKPKASEVKEAIKPKYIFEHVGVNNNDLRYGT